MKKFFYLIVVVVFTVLLAACTRTGTAEVAYSGSTGSADLTGAEGDVTYTAPPGTQTAATATPPPAPTAVADATPPDPPAPVRKRRRPAEPPPVPVQVLPTPGGGGWRTTVTGPEWEWVKYRQAFVPEAPGFTVVFDNNSDKTAVPYDMALQYRDATRKLYPCNGDASGWIPAQTMSGMPVFVLPAGMQACMTIPRDACNGGCNVAVNVIAYTMQPMGGYATEMHRRTFSFRFPYRARRWRQPLE